MKYTGMPMGMWLLFSGSFRKQLEEVLGYSREEACKITVNAKRQYRKLIGKLPEFERKDPCNGSVGKAGKRSSRKGIFWG